MRIAVYGRSASEENCRALQHLCHLMAEHNLDIIVHEEFMNEVRENGTTITCSYDTFQSFDSIDLPSYVLSIGGDGTLLNTADLVKNSGIPVVGINTGRLGFLANFTVDQLPDIITTLQSGSYDSDLRSLLQIECNKELFDGDNYALNEFTIQKRDPSAIIKVHAYLNGEFLSSYWSDGVIVSTPTGSTGYSLSAGGPIIMPDTSSFVITPIAPHNLNLRPIVIADSAELTLKIGAHRGSSYCTIDSKHWEIESNYEFLIKKADYKINIVRPLHQSFINTLKNKLMWGIDNRNKE